jgi:cyanophycinase
MMRPLLILLLLSVCPEYAIGQQPQGSLVIIGSNLRRDETKVWERIVQLAGGPGAKIAIFPTASEIPLAESKRVSAFLKDFGAEPYVVPLAVKELPDDPRLVVHDAEICRRVRECRGIYFVGGSQAYIVDTLRIGEGQKTPLLEAVWDVYRGGGVIVGCSAGAAIMSRVMYRDAPSVLGTMFHGVRMGREIDYGLGFLDENWFIDQHCLTWGRFARAIVAMRAQGVKLGLGIDENTALVVTKSDQVELVGFRGAVLLDLRQATSDLLAKEFNLRNVRVSYLDRGDRVNLRTVEVMPAQEKLSDHKLDPRSPDFKPYYDEALFSNDILANNEMPTLITKLMDSTRDEATGLAFFGHIARVRPTKGFEFRFTRDKQSVGWFTEAFGNDNYTVLNVRLDILPIALPGSFYQEQVH